MVSKSVLKYIKVSPKKVGIVLDVIRNKNVEDAFSLLSGLKKKSSPIVVKALQSAVANASEKGYSETEYLYVKTAIASAGPALKRYKSRAMGRATPRKKRTSHIVIELEGRGL